MYVIRIQQFMMLILSHNACQLNNVQYRNYEQVKVDHYTYSVKKFELPFHIALS